jgi:hypothetical protein
MPRIVSAIDELQMVLNLNKGFGFMLQLELAGDQLLDIETCDWLHCHAAVSLQGIIRRRERTFPIDIDSLYDSARNEAKILPCTQVAKRRLAFLWDCGNNKDFHWP